MKRFMQSLALAASFSVAMAANGTGAMTCDSGDQSTWKTKEALEQSLVAEGWQVRKVKVDGGCYEVYGTTPEGDRVEAYFDPINLEKLYVARRGEVLFKKAD